MRAGTLAALIYLFYSDPVFYGYTTGYWARSQAETYMAPFLVAGLWVFVRFLRTRSAWLAWLAGLFWGAAFLYKYTAVFYPTGALVFLGLFLASTDGGFSRRTARSVGLTFVMLACGFGTGLVPLVIYFGFHGALRHLFEATVVYNLEYTGAVGGGKGVLGPMLGQVTKWVQRNPFLWLSGMAGVIVIGLRAKENRTGTIWLFWLAAAWGAIALNRRYFHYYFIQTAAPLAMLSAYILDASIGWVKKRNRLILVMPLLAACLLLVLPDIWKVRRNIKPDLEFAVGKTPEPDYWARFVTGDFWFLADRLLADYLKERTEPEDRILVFGFEPLVYFLADRKPASRFIFNDPITAAYVSPETRRKRLDRLVSDLERNRPAYIVIVKDDANPVDPTDSYEFFMNTPRLRSFLETGYVLDQPAPKFHVYRRKTSAPGVRS
jgi:hypothetical protein